MDGCVVVGTDGSKTAERALTAAIEMAKAFSQPLCIVSAYRPDRTPISGLPREVVSTLQPDSRVDSVLAEAEFRARLAGLTVTIHPVLGDAAQAILDVAEEMNAGVIVVGNRGIGSKARFVLGNIPSRVVHNSPCSTFVVHTS